MRKKRLLVGFLFILLFIGFTYLVKTVDVNKVGEQNVLVGFSYINRIFSSIFRYNEFFYKLSNIFGYSAFVICAIYGFIGLMQLIARKDVKKVDEEILLLGFLYVTILIIKLAFDYLIIVNNRPVLIGGILEPSYPSSHTFMALVVCGSAIIINKKKYNNIIARVGNYVCLAFMILIVVTRLLSGAHWFTDIVGAIMLSFGVLLVYSGLITDKK